MTIIEQIKAEIERRIRELDEQIVDIYDSKAVLRKDELQKLLSFFSDLEKSLPINSELRNARRSEEEYQKVAEEMRKQIAESGSSEIPKDLEEAAKEYFKKEWNSDYQDFEGSVIDTFIAGAKWQKELMMGGAIEAVARPLDKEIWCDLDKFLELEDGDDICIIIIKEN